MPKVKRSNKLVITSDNIKSNALKNLAAKLSEKVGYRVYRVARDRVRGRAAVQFLQGIDKRTQFQKFHEAGVAAPQFCTDPAGVAGFAGKRVVVRHLTNASEGRGIELCERESVLPVAPLYVDYIPKKKEFRVHVWNGEVIDVAEKRKRGGFDGERNTQIRNTANGYVFCRTGVVEPDDLRVLATRAVASLGRTQGAVDVIWNEKQNKCYVLEVNSRPGMEGTTVEKYADAIIKGVTNV